MGKKRRHLSNHAREGGGKGQLKEETTYIPPYFCVRGGGGGGERYYNCHLNEWEKALKGGVTNSTEENKKENTGGERGRIDFLIYRFEKEAREREKTIITMVTRGRRKGERRSPHFLRVGGRGLKKRHTTPPERILKKEGRRGRRKPTHSILLL